jgi:hypothetical protein
MVVLAKILLIKNKMTNLTPPIIRKTLTVIGFSALSLFAAIPAYSASFNFNWNNNDPNIIDNPSAAGNLTVVGSLDINKNAGESFIETDISNVNLLATTPDGSFTFTSLGTTSGAIAANGLSASITDIFTDFGIFEAFGCNFIDCSNLVVVIGTSSSNNAFSVNYDSQANAQASFQLTASPVPFEFSPALGLGVLGGAWLVSKKFKVKSAKV